MLLNTPNFKVFETNYKDRNYQIEYFIRKGSKQTILFVHGLGGAKENFFEAVKSKALKDCTLIAFDNPGTGNSTYYEDQILNIDDLVEITSSFINFLGIDNFILAGASMGGLITLLYLQQKLSKKINAYINIEGNLMPEDCMFSSKVVKFNLNEFKNDIFPNSIIEMKQNGNTGYHVIANNLELNTNVISYYYYSFPTVEYSYKGNLLKQFIDLALPKLFIYGEKNSHLSYLPQFKDTNVKVAMIKDSDHFVFYDNPKQMYDEIASFINL